MVFYLLDGSWADIVPKLDIGFDPRHARASTVKDANAIPRVIQLWNAEASRHNERIPPELLNQAPKEGIRKT